MGGRVAMLGLRPPISHPAWPLGHLGQNHPHPQPHHQQWHHPNHYEILEQQSASQVYHLMIQISVVFWDHFYSITNCVFIFVVIFAHSLLSFFHFY